MPIAPNFTSVLIKDWEINFLQCSPNGYLKYTDLCNLFQITASIHAELGGISFSDMQQFNQAWVLSKMRVEIHKLPKWRDLVTIKTWIHSLENSRSIRCLEMYIGDEKIVGCETFWAVFNTQTRRPEHLAIPHEHFEKFPKKATIKSFEKIDIQQETEVISKQKVLLSDLDIVNHVNSAKYLEWCLNYVDFNIIQNQKIASLEMNYLKELSLNDEVTINKNTSELDTVFLIKDNSKTNFILRITEN